MMNNEQEEEAEYGNIQPPSKLLRANPSLSWHAMKRKELCHDRGINKIDVVTALVFGNRRKERYVYYS